MTEEEWLACRDPEQMLDHLGAQQSPRKSRLYAVACCRSLWRLLTDTSRRAIEVSERLADGNATNAERRAAALAALEVDRRANWWAQAAASQAVGTLPPRLQVLLLQYARSAVGYDVAPLGTHSTASVTAAYKRASDGESVIQAALLRDVFGNPFRPIVFSPVWRTDTAVALARTMYDSREFSAMQILADALQDAGCDNTDVLNHCRDPQQVHVRGCWVVDLVLGKS